jgi:hypothetical protein
MPASQTRPGSGNLHGDRGIAFAAGPDGQASSRHAGTQIMAAALGTIDRGQGEDARREARWRHAYPQHFRRLVLGGLRSADVALASARAGLDAAWQAVVWQGEGGTTSLRDALAQAQPALHTATLQGQGDAQPARWSVPVRGELLQGEALAARIDDWVVRGIIEPSAGAALQRCLQNPQWFDLSDRTLVLLGAGSEAGPLRWLARWRARIVAVDVPDATVWRRIAATVAAGNATLLAPLRRPFDARSEAWLDDAGVDLLAEAPRAAAWVRAQAGPLDIAALGYLDGERHVRLSLAMDMVQQSACAADPRTTLAWMATPTDVFAVPEPTALRAMAAFEQRPAMRRVLQLPMRLASGDRLFHANVEELAASETGRRYGIVDSLVVEQGPNYALAKRLQQWRALLARAAGHRTCLNVAPSTTTASVLKNPAFAAGFAGADTFGVEAFEPATTNALMAALWVHDLRSAASAADPARALDHPFELFMDNACHGGLWPLAYRARSVLPMAAVLGWMRGKRPQN